MLFFQNIAIDTKGRGVELHKNYVQKVFKFSENIAQEVNETCLWISNFWVQE